MLLRMNFRAMRQAEKDAMRFIKNLDTNAKSDDFLYIIHLLNADEKKEKIHRRTKNYTEPPPKIAYK